MMRVFTFVIPCFILGSIVLGMCLGASGCEEQKSSSDVKQAQRTEMLMQEADAQIGMPNITNFQQKKLMKLVMEETDRENLVCYAYIKSDYNGTLTFIGKCVGYGVPFSAQFTNPEKLAYERHGVGALSMPQPDPNGLFMPTSSSATWLLMIDPDTGKGRPVYLEPEIVVSPFPLHSTQ